MFKILYYHNTRVSKFRYAKAGQLVGHQLILKSSNEWRWSQHTFVDQILCVPVASPRLKAKGRVQLTVITNQVSLN